MESSECFLCSTPATVKLNISNTTTRYQKIPINSILDAFAGNEHIEIVITNTDAICVMCKLLLDELDCMRFKSQNIEQMIARKLHRKYQFDEVECELPAIRLDEQTTKLYGCGGKSGHKFQCTKCVFATDFQDCLLPHSLYHQCAYSLEGNKTIDGAAEDFACKNCQIILPTEELFKQHMTMFHASVDTEVKNGQIALSDQDNDAGCSNDEGFQCKVSVFPTPSKNSFKNFTLFNDISFEIPRQECAKTFSNEQTYVQHMDRGHFNCTKCKQKCRNATTLANHIALRHTQYTCNICGKRFSSRITYNAHQSTHGFHQNFICAYCDKGFRAKSLLATHIVMHSSEKNFTCHICGQRFVHQRAHRLHVKWHENPRPYQCDVCEKTFTHSSHLATHRRLHTGNRPKLCTFCDRSFINASKLKLHLATHTGNYLHSCVLCQKGFDKRYKYEGV